MKNLAISIFAVILLSSCSKNTVKDVTVSVTENGQYQGNPSFAINAEYTPETFGENIEEFAVEITVTATSNSQPTVTKIITLRNNDFKACRGEMVHGLGYHFNSEMTGAYQISHTKRML